MSFNDSDVILILTVAFALIGAGGSVIYYFARYYVKTGTDDTEVFKTHKEIPDIVPVSHDSAARKPVEAPIEPKRTVGDALKGTRETIWGRLSRLTSGEISENLRDEVEEVLLTSDLGPQTAELLFASIENQLTRSEKASPEQVKVALRAQMQSIFIEAQSRRSEDLFARAESLIKSGERPVVWMMAGVNGAGKTTTIGKFAAVAKSKGWSVLVAAGDTFRAAADSQLKVWAERSGAKIFSPENTKDPAAVAHMALEYAKKENVDLVLVDTAGRLHTQHNLMDELRKMKRVMTKVVPSAPHEVLLTVDANSGQNALHQAREFHAALDISGVVISKLDGSSKGGVLVGIAHELKLPICYIGIGEKIEDLKPFDSREFVESIL